MQEDKLLSSRFENFEAAPSNELWGNIEAGLAEKSKKRPMFWWFFGSAASIGLLFGLIHFLGEKNASVSLDKVKQKLESAGMQPANTRTTENFSTPKKSIFTSTEKLPMKQHQGLHKQTKNNWSVSMQNSTAQGVHKSIHPVVSSKTENKTWVTPLEVPESPALIIAEVDTISTLQLVRKSTIIPAEVIEMKVPLKSIGYEIGFSIGAGRGAKIINPTPTPAPSSLYNASTNVDNLGGDPNIYYWLPSVPLQLQLTIGKDLRNKFRVSSGLGFSFYTDKTRLKVPDELITTKRTNIVQLPLTLDYKIIQKSKWEWTTGLGFILGYSHFKIEEQKLNRLTSNAQWQTAFRYTIKSSWSTYFQPYCRYQLGDNYFAKSIFYKKQIWGLNLGVVKSF